MKKEILLLIITLTISPKVFSQNPNFHIYLCFGQSNMEGSALIEAQDKVADARFLTLQPLDCSNLLRKKNNWYVATPPLSQCHTGLSPADYFGKTMIKSLPDSVKVGVINIAIGGSDIRIFDKEIYKNHVNTYKEDWFTNKVKGYRGNPYQHLIELAKEAQKKGVIKGILLHQGETNQDDEKWPSYVKKVYENMLNDLSLKASSVPLLAGELVHEEQKGVCASMNPIINKLPKTIPTAHIISSKGCEARKDNVHFNSKGVRELGKRYALKMLNLQGIKDPNIEPEKPYNIQISRLTDDSFTVTWHNDLKATKGTNVFIEEPASKSGDLYLEHVDAGINSYTFKGEKEEVTITNKGFYLAKLQSLPDADGNAYTTAFINMKEPEGEKIEFDPNFHVYLCIGQSNMEGSANIESQDLINIDERFKVLQSLDCSNLGRNENKWYTAIPPLSHCNTGLSPADYFGRSMVAQLPENIKVGVVHVAVGGCDIRLFDRDKYQNYNATINKYWFTDKVNSYRGNPYSHLINLAKKAQQSGVIKGILLHQGETNQDDEKWPSYVKKVYENILNDLSLKPSEVPLIVGELVHEEQNGVCASMNSIINDLPKTIPTAHVVSSKGCKVKKDNLHFNSEGIRELGKRYADKMLRVKKDK